MGIISVVCFVSVLAGCRATTTMKMFTTTTTSMEGTTTASANCPTTTAADSLTTSYGGSCYEVVSKFESFTHADSDCRKRHGHLVTIDDAAEQDYVYQFLVSNNINKDVWIGLTDHRHEEHFTWTSGARVSYTHWSPNRKDNLLHGVEDCVVMQPAHEGLWEDTSCGGFLSPTHYYVCEYSPRAGHVVG